MAFHVHRAPDHEGEGRHTHGPAIHHHDDHQHFDSTHGATLDDDDESAHSVLTLTLAPAAQVDAPSIDGAITQVASLEPALVFVQRIVTLDVRSHGPPVLHLPSYRGPPTCLPV